MATETPAERAFANAIASIKEDTLFPDKVFAGDWDDYLFFESLALFGSEFIDAKNLLLRDEDASAIAVINLGCTPVVRGRSVESTFLEEGTQRSDFFAALEEIGSSDEMMFVLARYVAASDKGNWAFYCEQDTDIAVLALGEAVSTDTRKRLKEVLKAIPIGCAPGDRREPYFDFEDMLPEFRSALVAAYGGADPGRNTLRNYDRTSMARRGHFRGWRRLLRMGRWIAGSPPGNDK
ncbi:hypothetical protein FHS78_002071 [Parvibaculum indicum]|uniref:hypothetical protein n=1 Tax=Parvibaculum indicum TaxID=562969 RepID=UPI001422F614|nr:hypothetical protein [Parvibaculum indicum]NIJ41781.1 hypothetical protein [Parvibaculum indicum]